MKIINCKINHLKNPIGFQLGEDPSFSWQVIEAKGKKSIAERLIIKTEGKVIHDTNWGSFNHLETPIHINLKPRQRYEWTVSVRTDQNEEAVSDINYFETGKMDEPWLGKWITVPDASENRHPIFKKSFSVHKKPLKASLYICGLGLYEAELNGSRISLEHLTPYCNAYDKWLQVETFDISKDLHESNEIRVTLGNGWYKGRFGFDLSNGDQPAYDGTWKLIAEIHITYEDGSEEVIGTDDAWDVECSNITFSNIYDGEHVDDTLPAKEQGKAIVLDEGTDLLKDRLSPPVTKHEEFKPKLLITPKHEKVFDIGQNMAGIFNLKVHEPYGKTIHLQFGEVLQDGCFYNANLRSAKAEYYYVSDGNPHVLEPHFTYYGYRYVKVEGIENLSEDDFKGIALYTDMDFTGTIETGNKLVNRLFLNTLWGMKSNYLDVPTDCPQRDERMGWTGDTQVFSRTGMYLADTDAFMTKYLYDLYQEQKNNQGAVPIVIPAFHMGNTSSVWGDVATIVPMNLYEMFGDSAILEKQYESMKAWIDYIKRVDGDNHGWRRAFHFGDWLALDGAKGPESVRGATDESFIADVYYRKSVLITAKAAEILNKKQDAEKLYALAKSIEKGIQEEFYTPTGRCAIETQTGQILSLEEGLGDRKHAVNKLTELLAMNLGKLATGFTGTPRLCEALSHNGLHEKAYDLLLNEEYPGWLYEVKLGATTIWERWNSLDENGHITGIGMNSLNHYSYGSIIQWMFDQAAGLEPLEPGFSKAWIHPVIDERLGYLKLHYTSASGHYEIHWKIVDDKHMHVEVSVPFDCIALLKLPLTDEKQIELESGHYVYDYETKMPTHRIIQMRTLVNDALKNEKVKAYLESIPMFVQSEFSMGSSTIEEALTGTCRMDENQLEKIKEELLEIQL